MPIPQQIKASVGLARLQRYSGAIATAEMPRLQPDLAGPSEPLQAEIELHRDHQGEWFKASIRGVLMLQCQRCFDAYAWTVDLRPRLLLVDSEAEEQRVLETADPYRIENDSLPLHELIEDEVLLALPIVPRCQSCEDVVAAMPSPLQAKPDASSKTSNPFAQLSSVLKNDSTDSGGAAKPRRK